MFRDRDLALRLLAALLPAPSGYALTRWLTPVLGGARHRHVAAAVARQAAAVLGDAAAAEAAGQDFASAIACDDLDGLTAWLWPRVLRRAWLRVEGEDDLPPPGRTVFATFHVSGGFRIYDALAARGFRPGVLGAFPGRAPSRYQRTIDRARVAVLHRDLGDGVFFVGPGVARGAIRSPARHLAAGGAVVTAIDVAPASLGLRDAGRTTLFGRAVELPIGLLRLAAASATPVVPFDARLERGRRVIRFHRAITSSRAEDLLDHVAATLEQVVRERPGDWQGWLDVERLLASPRPAPAPPPRKDADAPRAARDVRARDGRTPDAAAAPARGPAIVIPIHDAADDVRRCVESVLAHAPDGALVVLVDDASQDSDLRRWLDTVAAERGATLLRNPANLGFVRSANRGLRAAAGRDAIVLNSDTIVPPGFVERLAAAAHHTSCTGIVSPFTNNGTIFSVPAFMGDNPLPEGLDLAGFDALIAATSLRRRPEVVTAHGFCFYVRAEVLERVGLLDEERFERGYGEENDLCERAKAAGFEVRLCDDLFVYHRGGASFGAEARALEERHLEILERLHPGYRAAAQGFIAANPLAAQHASIDYHLARRAARGHRALLFLLHANPFADPRRESMGGTQYHLLDLVRSLALPRAAIAWPEPGRTCVAEVIDGDVARPRMHALPRAASSRSFAEQRLTLRDIAAEAHVDEILDLFDVGAAHLHHLAWWPIGLWRRLVARDVPYACMLQDYYAVCPSWNLLDLERAERCACTGAAADERHRCLASWFTACGVALPADPIAYADEHRTEFAGLLEHAAAAIAPCEATRAIVARAHPVADVRWRVIPYGDARGEPPEVTPAPAERTPGPLRVALIGAVAAPWKGSEAVLEVMRRTRDLDLAWHVFGDSDAYGFPERARAAAGDAQELRFHGRYAREEIVACLRAAAVDVSLLLSPWDETYCYTLSESWAAGVPALVSDRGALAERTRASGGGLVAGDAAAAAAELRRLAQEPERLAALARAAAAHREISLAENARRHREACPELFARVSGPPLERAHGAGDRALFEAFARWRPRC